MESRLSQQRLRRMLAAAREEERRRCARELHDDTLQALAALRVQLSAARRADDMGVLRAALDGAVEELGAEIANLRALITELRPAALDELGLEPALSALFERAWTIHGLRVRAEVELAGAERLEADVETAIYRVVQESLTNAARHARADQVEVRVTENEDGIRVEVDDDGCGFDPAVAADGFGLTGMHERVALTGGRLEIRSSDAGTEIVAVLPADRRPRAGRAGKQGRSERLVRARTGAVPEAARGASASR